ncbi:hypothetical protein SAMN05660776_2600 [Salegentibacter holothuriorum]|uniref:Uncharacterized protein n=1 Tax=Salegentibacter holothuriorum TaxID=241145 RepID=A0A1T5DGB7_9FLAO|nr:hypothetical protein [Salegentibacter holothuriorum]SKB70611.1 hypothetical protein SAMN05660776_2600 [Salegentibacter holothuriorum]
MQKQSFDLQANLLQAQFPTMFKDFVFILLLFFAFLILINLFKNIFVSPKQTPPKDYIVLLLIILNKIFLFGGIGFIVANIIKNSFEEISSNDGAKFNFLSVWEEMAFGIILLFVGIGLNKARKIILDQSSAINTREQ